MQHTIDHLLVTGNEDSMPSINGMSTTNQYPSEMALHQIARIVSR